ncbi:MAG: hypothetical protein SYC29_13455 [Planctomycetota bacterium]|nr:hypothetical protein [Planctomycetota bacterium]
MSYVSIEQIRRGAGEAEAALDQLTAENADLRRRLEELQQPPTKATTILLTEAVPPDRLTDVLAREDVAAGIYLSGQHCFDTDGDLKPNVRAACERIESKMELAPDAKHLCVDWEEPLFKRLAMGGWQCSHAGAMFRRLVDGVKAEFPQLLISAWGLPQMPWWVFEPDGENPPLHKASSVALEPHMTVARASRYVWEHCDWLCPGVYTRHRSAYAETIELWRFRSRLVIDIARDHAGDKPIIPCLCPFDQHHYGRNGEGGPLYGLTEKDWLEKDEWEKVLEYVASFRPAGAIIWCVPNWWTMGQMPQHALRQSLDLMKKILRRR